MIRIGLKNSEKLSFVESYLRENPSITNIIVFSPKVFELPCDYEQYSWDDIIMYKVFYPLLERINNNYLIIVNELLRTAKRISGRGIVRLLEQNNISMVSNHR